MEISITKSFVLQSIPRISQAPFQFGGDLPCQTVFQTIWASSSEALIGEFWEQGIKQAGSMPGCIPCSLSWRFLVWSVKHCIGILVLIFQRYNSLDYYFNYKTINLLFFGVKSNLVGVFSSVAVTW